MANNGAFHRASPSQGAPVVRTARHVGWIAIILIVALGIRLGAILATPDLQLASDPQDYDRHAQSVAAGDGYPTSGVVAGGGPTAIRPPAFPAYLAGVYKLTGHSVGAARVAQAVLGTLIVALVAALALMLWGFKTARIAAALTALFPPLIIDGMTLLSEPLFVVFVLSATLAVVRWRARPHTHLLVGAGVLVGLAWLTRSNGALLLLPLPFAVKPMGLWRGFGAYRAPAFLLASAVLVVAPWTVRNAVELNAFIPVTDQDGYTLAGTYNATSREDDATWRVATQDPAVARLVAERQDLNEAELNVVLRHATRRYILDHPGYPLEVALHNTLRLFSLGGTEFQREVAEGDYGLGSKWALLMTVGALPVFALAILGGASSAARRAPRWFFAVPGLMLFPVFILATNRTRAPIDPFLIMLGALGLRQLCTAAQGRMWDSRRLHHET